MSTKPGQLHYYPPLLALKYDLQGRSVTPEVLTPTLDPRGYIQTPPMALTTLEAARYLQGDSSISAIRVKVAGIERYDEVARQKIESVASEILRLTGLRVDIMAGSSPRRVLVRIPGFQKTSGLGYVEELWVQKGLNIAIQNRVKTENILLFSIMLFVTAAFIWNASAMTTLGRIREMGILRALGWHKASIERTVLGENALAGLLAGILGIILASAVSAAAGLEMSPAQSALIIPVSIGLSLAGGIYPAWLASRVDPVRAIHTGEIITTGRWRLRLSWWGYALTALSRRPGRTILTLGLTAIPAALLVLILLLVRESGAYLSATLLGSYILLHVEWYHYLLIAICALVASIAAADTALITLSERQREMATLLALGWQRGHLSRLLVTENIALGIVAGTMGTAGGALAFWIIYGSLPWGSAPLVLAGFVVPVVILPLAALYSIRHLRSLSPAEALRYE